MAEHKIPVLPSFLSSCLPLLNHENAECGGAAATLCTEAALGGGGGGGLAR